MRRELVRRRPVSRSMKNGAVRRWPARHGSYRVVSVERWADEADLPSLREGSNKFGTMSPILSTEIFGRPSSLTENKAGRTVDDVRDDLHRGDDAGLTRA